MMLLTDSLYDETPIVIARLLFKIQVSIMTAKWHCTHRVDPNINTIQILFILVHCKDSLTIRALVARSASGWT